MIKLIYINLIIFFTIDLASILAFLYIVSGVAWSINLSGKTIDWILGLILSKLLSDKYCITCDPKPPTTPSSIVTSISWLDIKFFINLVSRGLQKRASATVVLKPFSSNIFAASKDSYNLAPKDKIAILLPFL